MTINLSETSLYIGTILVLIGIQIYQQIRLSKLERENEELWDQMANLTSGFVSKLLETIRNNKENEDKRNS